MPPSSQMNPLSLGAYTVPDAARLLGLPAARLRGWIRGVGVAAGGRRMPAGDLTSCGEGADRHLNFYTLIELFSLAELRELGVSMRTLRASREELAERYGTRYPFALRGLLTDGRRLLKELGDQTLLELGTGGQSAFQSVVEPFCRRLDFDVSSQLASRYFPLGRDSSIVVSPRYAFGRPVIAGTNLATETIAALVQGGESIDDVADAYQLPRERIEEAWLFEQRHAA